MRGHFAVSSEVAVEPRVSCPPAARVQVCGVRFDNLTMNEAIQQIDELLRSRRNALVVTPNVDHVVRARRDPAYASLIAQADLTLADGQPIVWASRLAGRPLKERVAGSDLFPRLCEYAARMGYRVFFLGGAPASGRRPGAADAAREVLVRRHPDLQVAGVHCPPHGFESNPAEVARAIRAISDAQPDIVFVGLGSPKQERWIVGPQAAIGPAVSVGIGISFSFVAGHVRRAPRWMQFVGLEWLHRLSREPLRLWRRYLLASWAFVPMIASEMWRRRIDRSPIPPETGAP